jgi:ribosomal protein S18 acetylase RimI-like enzyme
VSESLDIRAYEPTDQEPLIALWHACELVVPWNDPASDIAAKLAFQPDGLLVAPVEGRLAASVMVGYEGHRGWVNYLAVDPAFRGRGYGAELMRAAEAWLQARGCPKLNLQVRGSNTAVVAFYERLGYRRDDTVGLGKRLDG